MTYGGFLLRFLVVPIVLLAGLAWHDARGQRQFPPALRAASLAAIVAVLVVVAVAYTTPWDNYLVATGVWFYDPALVWGITLGWVPLEEYLFFVLQTVMVGLYMSYLWRRMGPMTEASPSRHGGSRARLASVLVVGALWLLSVAVLVVGWDPGRYLALLLAWALPPIMLQLGVGADILWGHRGRVLAALLGVTGYLGLVDALAIDSGTWTIAPAYSLEVYLFGVLPLEELIFFLITNTLIVFGALLALARETWQRLPRRLAPARAAE